MAASTAVSAPPLAFSRLISGASLDESEWRARLGELRAALERRDDLVPYKDVDGREGPWPTSPAGTDASLCRFLVARKGDVASAADMYAAHLGWRQRAFPIPRSGKVAEILDEKKRFVRMTPRDDGMPVLMVHHLWGHFITEEVAPFDALRASLRFLEDEIALGEEQGHHSAVCISFGGPPQIGWVSALAACLTANYPERLHKACIYPVPKLISRFVWAMLWFLDEGTRSKVNIHFDEDTFLESVGWRAEQLPEDMCGGFRGIMRRFRPDEARMNRLMYDGLLQNRGQAAELQRRLLEERPEEGAGADEAGTDARRAPAAEEPCVLWQPSTWFACCVARPSEDPAPRRRPRPPKEAGRALQKPGDPLDGTGTSKLDFKGRPSAFLAALLLAVLLALGLPFALPNPAT